jgi:hypothetical protein
MIGLYIVGLLLTILFVFKLAGLPTVGKTYVDAYNVRWKLAYIGKKHVSLYKKGKTIHVSHEIFKENYVEVD